MVTFDYNAAGELFPPRLRKSPHRQFGYRRFARADAVRFAIEELPPQLLSGVVLEKSMVKDVAARTFAVSKIARIFPCCRKRGPR
jgi:hypothetical protein